MSSTTPLRPNGFELGADMVVSAAEHIDGRAGYSARAGPASATRAITVRPVLMMQGRSECQTEVAQRRKAYARSVSRARKVGA